MRPIRCIIIRRYRWLLIYIFWWGTLSRPMWRQSQHANFGASPWPIVLSQRGWRTLLWWSPWEQFVVSLIHRSWICVVRRQEQRRVLWWEFLWVSYATSLPGIPPFLEKSSGGFLAAREVETLGKSLDLFHVPASRVWHILNHCRSLSSCTCSRSHLRLRNASRRVRNSAFLVKRRLLNIAE